MFRKIILVPVLLLLCLVNAYSEKTTDRISVSVGMNSLHIKYGVSSKWDIASCAAYGERIWMMGGRLVYTAKNLDTVRIYSGLEAGWINYQDVEQVSGYGYMVGLPVGTECFLSSKFALATEISPAMISLSVNNFDITHTGISWIWNVYVNYYFKR